MCETEMGQRVVHMTLMMTMTVFSMAVGPHDDDDNDGFQHGGWST